MDLNNDEAGGPISNQETPDNEVTWESDVSPEEEAREMEVVSAVISKKRRWRMLIAIALILTTTWILGQFGDPFVQPPQ